MKQGIDDLTEEIVEIAEEEMDCEHEVSRDEDGVNHSVNYFLSEKGTWKIQQVLKHYLEE